MGDRERLLAGRHADPFAYLGIHAAASGGHVVRAYLPGARRVTVGAVADNATVEAQHTGDGLFEACLTRLFSSLGSTGRGTEMSPG